ncbi:MAG: CAP domain-containing protein [Pseudomonadota bacterium]
MAFRGKSIAIAAAFALVPSTIGVAQAPKPTAQSAWLNAHNIARAEFGSPALKWNDGLASEARDWARKLARSGRFQHASRDQRKGRGENLWMGTRGGFAPHQMIDSFVSEKRWFRPGKFPAVSTTGNWADVGHYTQIVWRDTREVGCAVAQNSQYDVLVCRYWPAGNMVGTRIAPRPSLARR